MRLVYLFKLSENEYLFFFQKGGDLEKRIKQNQLSNKNFDLDTIYLWAKELINGLDHLHSSDIIHKDLKPRFKISFLNSLLVKIL